MAQTMISQQEKYRSGLESRLDRFRDDRNTSRAKITKCRPAKPKFLSRR